MMNDDAMEHWQWCDRLSVVEAAMLSAGIDPGRFELVGDTVSHDVQLHEIGWDTSDYTYSRSPMFVAVFRAIRAAALAGDIAAEFAHRARLINPASWVEPDDNDVPREGEKRLPSGFVLISSRSLSGPLRLPDEHEVIVTVEPDWRETSIRVDDLRAWMERKGRRPAFFFPETKADPLDFMNADHDHFAPELALAVKVWNALSSTQKTPGGVLETIKKWITEHPEEWGPLDCNGTNPKDRIATVVNWNKGGGASPTSG